MTATVQAKTRTQGREEVARLCAYFVTNRAAFLARGVKEAHVRQSLVDPLFEALGWDVRNAAQVAPQYREVIPEDSLEVEGRPKAPDYTFRVGTLPKFYAEAKKCGVNLASDPGPAYQLRRYGWSAKLPLCVLTDFEEFAAYDCTQRPRPSDKASHGRILHVRFEQYVDRWDELWGVFSREAVWSGAFDQFTASKRAKRGTSEVDTEFLKEIDGWRMELARSIALRNPGLSSHDLNRAVQWTIDRIVFLRMAEDRGLEPYEQLLKLCDQPDIYARFIGQLCQNADDKYNSGLFHFQKEKDVAEEPDRLTPTLTIDDKALRPILRSLYFAHGSPYQFSVIPVEILGTVYERFLGKVIRLTAGHQAKVEEKPEVRKAGGVYYTPAYVVDYIVQRTVGKQVEGRSPMQLAGRAGGRTFRVLDMACGSGSFLLGAYQCLLDHCLRWYTENGPEKHKKAVYRDGGAGEWRLSVAEKKRILTAHIFGVDIDPQAVEVSKLSLLLKVLEGESEYTMDRQKRLLPERALPNLAANIKCGNSLIGPDYFLGRLPPQADELRRVNSFDWAREFRDAENGGFDCVIGNPPYGHVFDDEQAEYLSKRYRGFVAVPDAYVAFAHKAHELLKGGGRFGFVIPSAWLGGPAYVPLRKYLLHFSIETIIALPFDVFEDAYIDTLILTTRKATPEKSHRVLTYEYPKREKVSSILLERLAASRVRQQAWHATEGNKFVLSPGMLTLIERLRHSGAVPLKEHVAMKRGVLFDPKLLTRRKTGDSSYRYFEGDVYRYAVDFKAPSWVEFGPKMREYPREFHWFQGKRILLRRLVNRRQRLMAGLVEATVITNKNLYVLKPRRQERAEYVLGLLNSRLFSRIYVSQVGQATKDDFPQVTIADLLALPFRPIDFSRKSDKAKHDRMVQLVESMLALHKLLAAAKSETETAAARRQIEATDAELDRVVYELYGLTEEEIALVESGKR